MFWIRNKVFAKSVIAKVHRGTPVFDMLAEFGRFLGGFNFAFAEALRSQFISNAPIAIQNRGGS